MAATSLQKKFRSPEIHEEMDQINTRADQKAKYEPEQLLNDHDPVATFKKTSPTPFLSIFLHVSIVFEYIGFVVHR